MTYEVKNFKPEFIEEQVRIGTEVLSKWHNAGQTPAEPLKKAYSGDKFDPETKFYAFKNGKMVGFLTSEIQTPEDGKPLMADLEFPIVVKSEQDASKLLFDEAISKLKEKGVKSIRTRAAPYWGDTLKRAKEFNYKSNPKVLTRDTSFKPAEIEIPSGLDFTSFKQYNKEEDYEATVDFIRDIYSLPETQLETFRYQLANIETLVGNIIAHTIIKEKGKVVGRQFVYSSKGNPEIITMRNPEVRGENIEETQKKLMYSSIEILQQSNVQKVNYGLFGQWMDKESIFKPFGLKFENGIKHYYKDL